MFSRKKSFPLILFFLFLSAHFLFISCDDSSSTEEKEVEQVNATIPDASTNDKAALFEKWDGTIPFNWTRSSNYYSQSNVDGYSADVIIQTYRENWEGKQIYLAHNFKNEDGQTMYEDIIFYFDNMSSCGDGYYIYLKTLPFEE